MFKYLTSHSVIITLLLGITISCSTPRPVGKTEAEIIFKEAKALIKDNRYILATEKLNSIRSQFPYSIYATSSELLLADVLFKQENYVEAAAAYILFKDFHPKYKSIDYVVLRIAESFYKQIPTFDRDLTPATEAIKYYNQLINFYPKSLNVKEARKRVKLCKEMLNTKEKYIADFYFKTEVYEAARYRYLYMIKNLTNTKELIDRSKLRVVQSSLYLNKKKDCVKYYNLYQNDVSKNFREKMKRIYKECK